MCYFITLGIKEEDRSCIEKIAKQRGGLSLWPAENPFVKAVYPASDTLFYVTSGLCSCDLVGHKPEQDYEEILRSAKTRYKKRGWSESKIKRALADKLKSLNSRVQSDISHKFCDAIVGLVEKVGSVRLFVHMYHGNQQKEKVRPTESSTISIKEFCASGGTFEEDKVVQIVV